MTLMRGLASICQRARGGSEGGEGREGEEGQPYLLFSSTSMSTSGHLVSLVAPPESASLGMLDSIHAGHGCIAAQVLSPQQVAGVAVQGGVRSGRREQRQHSAAHCLQRPGGAPRGLQDVQADLSGLRNRDDRAS